MSDHKSHYLNHNAILINSSDIWINTNMHIVYHFLNLNLNQAYLEHVWCNPVKSLFQQNADKSIGDQVKSI